MNILVAEDEAGMQLAVKAALSRAGHNVKIVPDGQAALDLLEGETFDIVISDQRMPKLTGQELLAMIRERSIEVPVVMMTAHGTIDQAVEAMQLGAADFITKPFSPDDLIAVVERVVQRAPAIVQSTSSEKGNRPIITNDPLMIRILEVCEAVARSDATVLVQGESGTGKELIARFVHAASPRAQRPFVAVNCAALPDNLLESELFGHEKGSFTGAQNRKIGKFEMAHGGTILLDEISEMDLGLQAKLLRVLQEREVDRVGGKDPVKIDVRVVATTNRDLKATVEKGEFRADLYYRLNVIPITLPSLRERRGDIRLLVQHFMKQYLGKNAPQVPDAVMQTIQRYRWPGNIRELQNAVERAAILSTGRIPSEQDFFLQTDSLGSMGTAHASAHIPVAEGEEVAAQEYHQIESALTIRSGVTVHEMEKKLILETLRTTDSNRTQAAKMLGISIRTLRNKLNEYRSTGDWDGADS
jgi:two-component system response regulator FlrC